MQFELKDRVGEEHERFSGQIGGEAFSLSNLKQCTVKLLDVTSTVRVKGLSSCHVIIAAASGNVMLVNCSNCIFSAACSKLITRDCHSCVFYLHTLNPSVVENSSQLQFAQFNVAYRAHSGHLEAANLLPGKNCFEDVRSVDKEGAKKSSWRIIEQTGEVSRPLMDGAELAVPKPVVNDFHFKELNHKPLMNGIHTIPLNSPPAISAALHATVEQQEWSPANSPKRRDPPPPPPRINHHNTNKESVLHPSPLPVDSISPAMNNTLGYMCDIRENGPSSQVKGVPPPPPVRQGSRSVSPIHPVHREPGNTSKFTHKIVSPPGGSPGGASGVSSPHAFAHTHTHTGQNSHTGSQHVGNTAAISIPHALRGVFHLAPMRGINLGVLLSPLAKDGIISRNDVISTLRAVGDSLKIGLDYESQRAIDAAMSWDNLRQLTAAVAVNQSSNVDLQRLLDLFPQKSPQSILEDLGDLGNDVRRTERSHFSASHTANNTGSRTPVGTNHPVAFMSVDIGGGEHAGHVGADSHRAAIEAGESNKLDRVRRLVRQGDIFGRLRKDLDLAGKEAGGSTDDFGAKHFTVEDILAAFRFAQPQVPVQPADVIALMRRAAGCESEDPAPVLVDGEQLRKCLLAIKLEPMSPTRRKHQIARGGLLKYEGWEERQRRAQKKEEKLKEREFQKALMGKKHKLTVDDLSIMASTFDILNGEYLLKEAREDAELWYEYGDGKRNARVMCARWDKFLQQPAGTAGPQPSDTELEILQSVANQTPVGKEKAAKNIVIRQKERETLASEQDNWGGKDSHRLSKLLLHNFDRENKMRGSKDGLSFDDWLRRREATRVSARKMEQDKEDVRRLRHNDCSNMVTTMAQLKNTAEIIASETTTTEKLRGGVQTRRPNQSAVEFGQRIQQLGREKRSRGDGSGSEELVTRGELLQCAEPILSSLTGNKGTARKAKELGGVSLLPASEQRKIVEEDIRRQEQHLRGEGVSALFCTDPDQLVARAIADREEKKKQVAANYKQWLKQKEKEAKRKRKEDRLAEAKAREDKERKAKAGKTAFKLWNKLENKQKYYSLKEGRVVERPTSATSLTSSNSTRSREDSGPQPTDMGDIHAHKHDVKGGMAHVPDSELYDMWVSATKGRSALFEVEEGDEYL